MHASLSGAGKMRSELAFNIIDRIRARVIVVIVVRCASASSSQANKCPMRTYVIINAVRARPCGAFAYLVGWLESHLRVSDVFIINSYTIL